MIEMYSRGKPGDIHLERLDFRHHFSFGNHRDPILDELGHWQMVKHDHIRRLLFRGGSLPCPLSYLAYLLVTVGEASENGVEFPPAGDSPLAERR